MSRIAVFLTVPFLALGLPSFAQESTAPQIEEDVLPSEPPMTLSRMAEIVFALDPNAQSSGSAFQLVVDTVPLLIVTDPEADRMRIMTPVAKVGDVSAEELVRVMQANFDTALDARYAIARDTLWSTFIHPLSPLEKNQFISGLGQTVNLAKTFGTLYTGGGRTFSGGDSAPIQRKLIEDLLLKGEEI
jgi:hypothetical protein